MVIQDSTQRSFRTRAEARGHAHAAATATGTSQFIVIVGGRYEVVDADTFLTGRTCAFTRAFGTLVERVPAGGTADGAGAPSAAGAAVATAAA